jgi:hypothetical protein
MVGIIVIIMYLDGNGILSEKKRMTGNLVDSINDKTQDEDEDDKTRIWIYFLPLQKSVLSSSSSSSSPFPVNRRGRRFSSVSQSALNRMIALG